MTAVVSRPSTVRSQAGGDRSPRRRRRVVRRMIPVVGLAATVGLWQLIVVVVGVPTYLVPAPTQVARALVTNWALISSNIGPTAYESLLGFLLGSFAAFVCAIAFVYSGIVERSLFPVVAAIRTVPIIAIAPILVILFGNGTLPKVVIAALISYFPTLMNTIVGLKSVDAKTLELMSVLSARPWEVFFRVRMFVALPYIFSALKIATGNCVLGAIVGEWVGANRGLGYLIIQSTYNFNTTVLYATMVVVSILALSALGLITLAERLLMPWRAAEPR